jgi:hypothetical protein
MMKGIRRVTPDSKLGRSIIRAKGAKISPDGVVFLSTEQTEWNRRIEAKKKEKGHGKLQTEKE